MARKNRAGHDDKREERKEKKAAVAANRSVLDIVSQAMAKVNQAQYPQRSRALNGEIDRSARSARDLAAARSVVSLLLEAHRELANSIPDVAQVVSPDDSVLSTEERKILRAVTGGTLPQLRVSFRRAGILPRYFPIELQLDTDFAQKVFPGYPAKIIVAEQALKDALAEVSESKFQSEKERVVSILSQYQRQLTQAVADAQKAVETLDGDIEKLGERLEKARERSSRVDEALIYFALPGLAVLMIGLLIAPKIYRNDVLHLEVFKSGLLLELFTVFFITASILILGLGGRVDAPILGTLLGGISGYVLGRSTGRGKPDTQQGM